MKNHNKSVATSKKEITTDDIHTFFDNLIETIEQDRREMLIGTASEEKAEMIEKFIRKDTQALVGDLWQSETNRMMQELFEKYINSLVQISAKPETLAFGFDRFEPNTISVFAIVNDGDYAMVQKILSSEHAISPDYFNKGFKIKASVFQKSDKVDIPKGFSEFKI